MRASLSWRPHAELAESKRAERRFAALNQPETLRCHLPCRRASAKQGKAEAGRSQVGKPARLRKKPDLRLGKAGVEKRRKNLMLRGGRDGRGENRACRRRSRP